jgi:hypothetical protein
VPAAPAVANMYLQGKSLNGSDAPNLNTCKANNGGKSNWKGVLIGKVTDWMPKPESVKNSDPDWVGKVQDAVDAFCTNTTPTPYA